MTGEVRIGLSGYGRMGRIVESLATGQGCRVVAVADPAVDGVPDRFSDADISLIEVIIDFSLPGAVADLVERVARPGLGLVIGTTGWLDQFDRVAARAADAGLGLVHGANFSIGMNIFLQLAGQAAGMYRAAGVYDAFIEERHHRFKQDAPSGTALAIRDRMRDGWGSDVPVSVVRAGHIPGSHEVGFDAPFDSISLIHTARNREGFALGALAAARWIRGRTGVHEFSVRFNDILGGGR